MQTLPAFSRAFARRFADRFVATNCWEVAGGLAFTTLLAMVPMATLTLLFFRTFPALAALGEALREFLTAHLLPNAASAIITQYTEAFTANAGQLTALGSSMLLVTSLLLLITVEDVFNRIWNARRSRGWARRLTLYWFVLTAGPILVGGSIAAARSLASEATEIAGHTTWVDAAAAFLVPLLLLWLFFAFLYYAVPHHPVRGRIAALAGLVVALLFLALQRGFGWFVATIPTYTLIYGAFATLPIFLLWLYSLWLLILGGAVAAAAFEETIAEIRSIPPFPGFAALAAMTLLETLWAAQQTGKGVSQERLWHAAQLPPHECEGLLERLRELGWAERTEKGTWLAAIAPSALTPAAVLTHFALDLEQWQRFAMTPTAQQVPGLFEPALAGLAQPFSVGKQLASDAPRQLPPEPPVAPHDSLR
jgi:membrane protein